MIARMELTDLLFSENNQNSLEITEDSGQAFLNIRLAIRSEVLEQDEAETEPDDTVEKQRGIENFRDLKLNSPLINQGFENGKIELRKKNLDMLDGSSSLKITLNFSTKVPYSGRG